MARKQNPPEEGEGPSVIPTIRPKSFPKRKKHTARTPAERIAEATYIVERMNELRALGSKARGLSRRVARELGVTHAQVGRDYRWLTRQMLEKGMIDVQALRREEMADLDLLEAEAIARYRDSLQNKRSVKTTIDDKGGTSVATTEEDNNGDPRWFEAILAIKKRKADMLGLDAPKQTGVTIGIAGRAGGNEPGAVPDVSGWFTRIVRSDGQIPAEVLGPNGPLLPVEVSVASEGHGSPMAVPEDTGDPEESEREP